MSCQVCDAPKIRCRGLCNICYQREWRDEQRAKYGKKPRRGYGIVDPNEFWLWLRDEVKLVQAQPKRR
jgi:hypothetical protein